ncbi:L,D-transpeptidase [Micromonospora sp. NPDC000207]|uniref:L,D-transpeptidase n=1 Tax=Micromonospora sp. NPDC000207 TaxID=3154246 RepID=UPI003325A823
MRHLGAFRWRRAGLLVGVPLMVVTLLVTALMLTRAPATRVAAPGPVGPQGGLQIAPDGDGPGTGPVPSAAPAPARLPVVDYGPAPTGFPPDPDTMDVTPLTEGLRPARRIAAYDAPGGLPLAFLDPTVNGVDLTVPIAQRRTGWAAVLLPSANRRLAWVPPGGWTVTPLRNQIVIERRPHRLTWFRDGEPRRTWPVSLGRPGQETPLGRSFVLGRSTPSENVYAGVDVLALGSVPDDPDAVPAGLRGAHIGIHTWHHDGELGRQTTNGCIRLTASGQRLLLAEVPPGSPVVVVDELPTPPPSV